MVVPREGSASTATATSGRQFSNYTILESIGSGLRGTVFKARTAPGRLVALKVFNPGVGIDIETLQRFCPYSDGGISHPNLVAVEATGRSEGKAFCSMALLTGDSLEEILAELRGGTRLRPHLAPLGLGRDGKPRAGFIRHAVSILLHVAEGLGEAHRAGVIHGRLSPRNLILGPTGRLIITDFGSEESSGSTRRVGGGASHDLRTLAYHAPELIEPGAEIGAGVDVYALGAILYELLTRRPPFSGRDPRKVQDAILEGAFPPPSGIEPKVTGEAEAVILRAMAFDPVDRYPSAEELAEDLRRLLRLEATRAGAEVRVEASDVPEAIAAEPETQAEVAPPAMVAPATIDAPAVVVAPAVAAAQPAAPPEPLPEAVAPQIAEPPAEPAEPEPLFGWIQPMPLLQSGTPAAGAPHTPALWVAEPPAAEPEPVEPEPELVAEPAPVVEREATPVEVRIEPPMAPIPRPAVEAIPEIRLEVPRSGRRLVTAIGIVALLGGLGAWMWLTIRFHDNGERSRLRAAAYTSGVERLARAGFALISDDPPAARSLVTEARDLGAADPDLEALEGVLRSREADRDLSELSHPRAVLRREAIASISRGIEAGRRPASDLARIADLLLDSDPAVRQAAIGAVARGGSSAPLLAAFPIGLGRPTVEIDSGTLLALARALTEIADPPAEEAALAFGFDEFARLDERIDQGDSLVDLPPNLRVVPAAHRSSEFAVEWIRGRARLQSGELLALAGRLERGEAGLPGLAGEVIDALPALGLAEASPALLDLMVPLHLTQGQRIIDALRDLGAVESLITIAHGTLPSPLRSMAARRAGEAIAGAVPGGGAASRAAPWLAEILRYDPEPEVRRSALAALREIGAAGSPEVLEPALWDPALRDDALGALAARPVPEVLPVIVDLLEKGDVTLRAQAARVLGAARDPQAVAALAALLHEVDPQVRAASLDALEEIAPQRGVILAAGVLPPGSPELKNLAMAATCGPLDRTVSPALLMLAIQEALGINAASPAHLDVREARREILREQLTGAAAEER
jgi:protein kinase-like protein/HEAT repeat protein